MTAPSLDTPAAAAFVAPLSADCRGWLLVALLEEAIALTGGSGLIPIQTADGKDLGYYVPPKAADARFELYGPKLTAEEAEYDRRVRDPGLAFPLDDIIGELKHKLADLTDRRRPESAEPAPEAASTCP